MGKNSIKININILPNYMRKNDFSLTKYINLNKNKK